MYYLVYVLTAALCLASVADSEAGPRQLKKLRPDHKACFEPVGRFLRAEEYNYNGQRVNRQFFSTSGDDKPDYALYFEYVGTGGVLRPFATVKQVDLDGDMAPDKEYLDAAGNGSCKDVVEIPVGSGFTAKRMAR